MNSKTFVKRTWILHTSKLSLKIMWRKMILAADKYNILWKGNEATKDDGGNGATKNDRWILENWRHDQEYHSISFSSANCVLLYLTKKENSNRCWKKVRFNLRWWRHVAKVWILIQWQRNWRKRLPSTQIVSEEISWRKI